MQWIERVFGTQGRSSALLHGRQPIEDRDQPLQGDPWLDLSPPSAVNQPNYALGRALTLSSTKDYCPAANDRHHPRPLQDPAKLGRGGIGEVYRATDSRSDRDVKIECEK